MTFEIPAELESLVPSAAALDRLVYLVGPTRSGTTIINRSMAINPRALVMPSLVYFMQRMWLYRNKLDDRLFKEVLKIPNLWDEAAIRSRLGPDRYPAFVKLVNRALAERDLADMYKLYPVATALARDIGDVGAIACWHDKQNDWRYLGPLANAFPAGKFIFVARDPRSVVLSGGLRMAANAGEKAKYPKRDDIISMALYWRLLLQRCLDIAARIPDRCIVVRYEDFLTSPASTLNRIFSFTVGETMDEQAIELALERMRGGATNDPTARYAGISKEPLARWKDILDPEDIAIVERLTGPTARKLGYDIERKDGLIAMWRLLNDTAGASSRLKMLLCEAYETRIKKPT